MSQNQARAGGCAGLATAIGYLAFSVLPMPAGLRRLLFFFLPLSGMLFVMGLRSVLKERGDGVLLQSAGVFGIAGFAAMNLLAVVQIAIHVRMNARAPHSADPATQSLIGWIQDGVNAVHLGLDVSFDIFALTAFVLFGLAMARDPGFGRVFGFTGSALALATLAFNLYTFPVPPDPDLGPLVGLWALAVAIRMLRWGKVGQDASAAQQ